MVWFLRGLGWLLFGGGALTFIATGGFGGVREGNAVTMVGGVLMPVGMFLTAMCNAIANWRTMRHRPEALREQVEEHRADKAPEKQYKVRPLEGGKLSPSPGGGAASAEQGPSKEPDGPPSPPAPRG